MSILIRGITWRSNNVWRQSPPVGARIGPNSEIPPKIKVKQDQRYSNTKARNGKKIILQKICQENVSNNIIKSSSQKNCQNKKIGKKLKKKNKKFKKIFTKKRKPKKKKQKKTK